MRQFFSKLSRYVTDWSGSTTASVLAFLSVAVWFMGGFLWFGFGTDYQMWINTGTTIVTFLMVFLIQRTQNHESKATQLKLNELVASDKDADNALIDIESLTEEQIEHLHARYQRLAKVVKFANIHRGKVSIDDPPPPQPVVEKVFPREGS